MTLTLHFGLACATLGLLLPLPMPCQDLPETVVGRTICSYFTCEDLDCAAARHAVELLGDSALDPLVRALLKERIFPRESESARWQLAVRIRAANALGSFPGDASEAALIRSIQDNSLLLRAQSVRSLGRLRSVGASQAIAARLQDEASVVREDSATALASIGDAAALPALRQAMASEDEPAVLRAIQAAIKTLERRN